MNSCQLEVLSSSKSSGETIIVTILSLFCVISLYSKFSIWFYFEKFYLQMEMRSNDKNWYVSSTSHGYYTHQVLALDLFNVWTYNFSKFVNTASEQYYDRSKQVAHFVLLLSPQLKKV